MATLAAHQTPKSTENTVFVRFVPPSENIRRHHVEDLFSQVGPIKKSNVIHKKQTSADSEDNAAVASSYGFVRFTNPKEAQIAAKTLNNRNMKVSDFETVKIKVELASNTVNHQPQRSGSRSQRPRNSAWTDTHDSSVSNISEKKTSRLILRNLSFYAKEKEIRKAMSAFGEVKDVHIPQVVSVLDGSSKKKTQSRGFAFVTFANPRDARKCLENKDPVLIHQRPVQISYSQNKTAFEAQKQKTKTTDKNDSSESKTTANKSEDSKKDDGDDTSVSLSSNGGDSSGSSESDENDDVSQSDDKDDKGTAKDNGSRGVDQTAVSEKRCVFIRNISFDTTQQELFQAFVKYGYITGAYLVYDKVTNLPKGTAFVSYKTVQGAQRALEVSKGSSSTSNDSTIIDSQQDGIRVGGRRLLCELAVDKDTASSLKKTEVKISKDRRNIYLKNEGRVDNEGDNKAWDDLPELDQIKRQKASSDKISKLRSPMFFINPTRLSIRNLSKTVGESDLKRLVVEATKEGLSNGLVTAEDQIAHWKASGDLSTRDILKKIEEAENANTSVIPSFDDMNVKKFVPSVFIDRDFSSATKKESAPSRGFGFVEFTHHAHALACLRQLNNNIRYTKEYVQGGQHPHNQQKKRPKSSSVDNRIPRLIVEFTVENKAKAKQQADHRTAQRENHLKQKQANIPHDKAEKERKSRGKRQRERRKSQKDDGEDLETDRETHAFHDAESGDDKNTNAKANKSGGVKMEKPTKKRRVDPNERKFQTMVSAYQEQFGKILNEEEREIPKRWYD